MNEAAQKLIFRIRGMDCAEEVDALRKALAHLAGIRDLEFDLLNGTMIVLLESGDTGTDEIRAAVRGAGLEAERWDPATPLNGEDGRAFWARKGRLIMCAASGVWLCAGMIAHALAGGSLLRALGAGEITGRTAVPAAAIVFYAASVVCGSSYVLKKAWAAVRGLRADMNLLMVIAVVGAMAIHEWLEAAAVSFLFALALLMESWSIGRARRAIRALMGIAPSEARYYGPDGGQLITSLVSEVPVGVEVLVRPGERIPLDGVVTRGRTSVNQAPITGESRPVDKREGDPVFAGTINGEGAFDFKTTKPARDTTLARIVRMIEEVQSRRAPIEQWVEKFARYYTPAMIVIAVLIMLVPPLVMGEWRHWFYQALVMLVIACPCALVISTPVSIVAGLTSAAHQGVLIKGGVYLEAPAGLSTVVLDKTGTLTYGQPEVQQITPYSGHTPTELLGKAASLESRSEHPLARAILRRARADGIPFEPAEGYQAVAGKGAEAIFKKRRFWIGSHRLMHEKAAATPAFHDAMEQLEDAGHSVIVIGNDEHVCGFISLADSVRPEARELIGALRRAGIRRVVMLTGDNEGTARAVAEAVGVDSFHAELMPEDKLRIVHELVREHERVAMIGDGVNDAPAMAAATVGIAMGAAGTDVAIETADIALMSDDLSRLPWLIAHSRRTLRVIRQNITFALGVKLVFMSLAVAGAATLWMAIAADMGASLLVIFNGLRLLKPRARSA